MIFLLDNRASAFGQKRPIVGLVPLPLPCSFQSKTNKKKRKRAVKSQDEKEKKKIDTEKKKQQLEISSFLLRAKRDEQFWLSGFCKDLQSFLAYTTTCADGYEPRYRTIEKLIIDCNRNEKCLDERDTCEVLKDTLPKIVNEVWRVGENSPVIGYELQIYSEDSTILNLTKGNITNNYKNSLQNLGRNDIDIIFTAYY